MTDQVNPSESVENFIKAVYSLQQQEERVSTNTLSDALNISAPSVTDMAQRLVTAGLVDYQRYKGVVLTASGREMALRVLRRHRLIELYLVRELGYALREVHEEAEKLEHAVSERFIEAIAYKLGDPNFDPHGDPIPAADGTLTQRQLMPLTELPEHVKASVSQLKSSSPEMLQHILDRGFTLDSEVEVLARDPFDGPISARVDGRERIVGFNVAECILVDTGGEAK
ncbi:Diphtheria toxin repressor [Planctomycetaceae bacterium]|nr:Diphtheria toxin repressor [Planctomycetaceae bacterium]